MNLTEEQKKRVTEWIAGGEGVASVQKRLQEEFSINLTYLETRLLIAELNITPQDPPRSPDPADLTAKNESAPAPSQDPENEDFALPEEAAAPGSSKVKVTIDEIVKPGAMISGRVTFSDGKAAEWFVDAMGRMALNPDTPGYRPSESDIMAFQVELSRLARSQGY